MLPSTLSSVVPSLCGLEQRSEHQMSGGGIVSGPLKLCRHLKLERIAFVGLSQSVSLSIRSVVVFVVWHFHSNDLIIESKGRECINTQLSFIQIIHS